MLIGVDLNFRVKTTFLVWTTLLSFSFLVYLSVCVCLSEPIYDKKCIGRGSSSMGGVQSMDILINKFSVENSAARKGSTHKKKKKEK